MPLVNLLVLESNVIRVLMSSSGWHHVPFFKPFDFSFRNVFKMKKPFKYSNICE